MRAGSAEDARDLASFGDVAGSLLAGVVAYLAKRRTMAPVSEGLMASEAPAA